MSVNFMEGFETAITGDDYVARGVSKLSTFRILSEPQGRNGGRALARLDTNSRAGAPPTNTINSYVYQLPKPVSAYWSSGGFAFSIQAKYQSTITSYGIAVNPNGGLCFGTVDNTFMFNDTSFAISKDPLLTNPPSSAPSGNTLVGIRYSIIGDYHCTTSPTGSVAYFRNINSGTVQTVSNLFSTTVSGYDFNYHDGLYVAVGRASSSGTSPLIKTSPDLVNWTNVYTAAVTTFPSRVKYLEGPNIWVAVGINFIATSPDGITWTPRTNPAGSSANFAQVETDGTNIVAIGNVIAQSSDGGVTWTSRALPISGLAWWGLAASPTRFVAGNTSDGRTIFSTDGGLTWQVGGTGNAATSNNGIVYYNGKFIKGTTNYIEYSTDGLSWQTALGYDATNGVTATTTSTGPGGIWVMLGSTNPSVFGVAMANGTTGNIPWRYWNGVSGAYFNSSVLVTLDQWHRIDFVFTPTATANQFTATAAIDEVVIATVTVTASSTTVSIGLPVTGLNFFDDMVFTDKLGANQGLLGDVAIRAKFPTADKQAQWARVPSTLPSNASAVNAGALSLETSHIEANANNQEDIYQMSIPDNISGMRVSAIQTEMNFQKVSGVNSVVTVGVELNNNIERSNPVTLSGAVNSSAYVSYISEVDPNGIPWNNSTATSAGMTVQRQ